MPLRWSIASKGRHRKPSSTPSTPAPTSATDVPATCDGGQPLKSRRSGEATVYRTVPAYRVRGTRRDLHWRTDVGFLHIPDLFISDAERPIVLEHVGGLELLLLSLRQELSPRTSPHRGGVAEGARRGGACGPPANAAALAQRDAATGSPSARFYTSVRRRRRLAGVASRWHRPREKSKSRKVDPLALFASCEGARSSFASAFWKSAVFLDRIPAQLIAVTTSAHGCGLGARSLLPEICLNPCQS